jgi:hypothetical protein
MLEVLIKLIDFISHSWFDSVQLKLTKLDEWRKQFHVKNKRWPTIWFDKFCLQQTPEALALSVPCLPIYLLACEQVLLLKSPGFFTRLWCLTEIYTQFVMGPASSKVIEGIEIIELYPLVVVVVADNNKPMNSIVPNISLENAHCSMEKDEKELRANFERAPGGAPAIELAILSVIRGKVL